MIIIIIVLLLILLILIKIDIERSITYNIIPCGIFILIVLMFISAIFVNNVYISPIEVYRGNTTLEITYRDSIPVDSIVVLKNK